jgi:hypothetical protein
VDAIVYGVERERNRGLRDLPDVRCKAEVNVFSIVRILFVDDDGVSKSDCAQAMKKKHFNLVLLWDGEACNAGSVRASVRVCRVDSERWNQRSEIGVSLVKGTVCTKCFGDKSDIEHSGEGLNGSGRDRRIEKQWEMWRSGCGQQ